MAAPRLMGSGGLAAPDWLRPLRRGHKPGERRVRHSPEPGRLPPQRLQGIWRLLGRPLRRIAECAACRNTLRILMASHSYTQAALFCVGSAPDFINVLKFQELSDASFTPHVPTDNEEEVVAILYTSGSTGLPKGVEMSHKGYCSAFHTLRSFEPCGEEDVFLCWNPFTHGTGFAVAMFCMFLGTKIVLTHPLIPYKAFLETLKTHEVSAFVGIAGLMQHIVNEVRKNNDSVPRVKKIFMSGSVIPTSLAREVCEIFDVESLINCYGMTETFGLVCSSPVGQITFDNSGVPYAGIKIKVIDITSGESLGPFCNGEIVVHTRGVMKGYFGRPEATAEAFSNDGWLRTGDLGYYDAEGRIHVTERLKQMIKCMDNVVTPAELEGILTTHEAVAEVAVVGVPSSTYGEAPTACVVVKDGFETNLESLATELKELIAGDLGYYDAEGRIHVTERLKQMIKCMDNVVTPAELEEILNTHEAVAEAVVVGVPNSTYGEAPTACVVVKDGFEKNLESLATELKELIAGQAAVFKQLYGGVFFMKSLPKSEMGKILRQDLKTKVAHEIEKLKK
ncbi:4-coumarate--CoA ligase 1-like [Ixodes scapularis]